MSDNTVDLPLEHQPKPGYRVIALPSGRQAQTLVRPTGRHHRDASRVASRDPSMLPFALVAATSLYDGRELTAEELLEIDLSDWLALFGEVAGGGKS